MRKTEKIGKVAIIWGSEKRWFLPTIVRMLFCEESLSFSPNIPAISMKFDTKQVKQSKTT